MPKEQINFPESGPVVAVGWQKELRAGQLLVEVGRGGAVVTRRGSDAGEVRTEYTGTSEEVVHGIQWDLFNGARGCVPHVVNQGSGGIYIDLLKGAGLNVVALESAPAPQIQLMAGDQLVDLSRDEVNRLIRALRTARDRVHGKDA